MEPEPRYTRSGEFPEPMRGHQLAEELLVVVQLDHHRAAGFFFVFLFGIIKHIRVFSSVPGSSMRRSTKVAMVRFLLLPPDSPGLTS